MEADAGSSATENEDVSAEFDGWQVTTTGRKGDKHAGVDDEEQGRAFIGFDECTVSRRNRRARTGRAEVQREMGVTDASWDLTNDGMSRDGRDAMRERKKYGWNGEREDVRRSIDAGRREQRASAAVDLGQFGNLCAITRACFEDVCKACKIYFKTC